MPIYEYSCPTCKAEFEVFVRRDADIPATCPECGKGKPVKAFSTFSALTTTGKMPSCAGTCPSASDSCVSGPCGGGGCGL